MFVQYNNPSGTARSNGIIHETMAARIDINAEQAQRGAAEYL